jgi:hypothetical protein
MLQLHSVSFGIARFNFAPFLLAVARVNFATLLFLSFAHYQGHHGFVVLLFY